MTRPCARQKPPGNREVAAPADLQTDAPSSPPGLPPFLLVALDVDGTLLREDKQLTRRCADAVIQTTQRGARVVLASARPPRTLRDIASHLKLDTLQINYNGAMIHDPRRNRHVYHRPMDGDLVHRIVKAARRIEAGILVSIEILDKWYTDHFDRQHEELPTETSRRFTPDFVGPLESFLHVPVTKLMLLARPKRLAPVRAMIEKKFSRSIRLAVSDNHLIQVVHPSVDKAEALKRVAREYGVPREKVMAIGDAPNDVGMLRWAGLGVAMQNAWEETHHAADVIAPSNDQDGVAVALEKWVLRNC
jgi:Cof subfamily protein (haloacid dehalogenase superfamily)